MTRQIKPAGSPAGVTPLAAVSIIIIFAAVACAVLVRAGSPGTPARPAARARTTQERVEVELLTLRPGGFDPTEITRPRGQFLLAVANRSGAPELELRLDREGGAREGEGRVTRGQQGWKKMTNLPPGRYVLTEANHPDWVCRITITPN